MLRPLLKGAPAARSRHSPGRSSLGARAAILHPGPWRDREPEHPSIPVRAGASAGGILVVEQDDEQALALEEALEDARFNVQCVRSIPEAELAIYGCQFDLVLLNWHCDENLRGKFLEMLRQNQHAGPCPMFIVMVLASAQSLPSAGTVANPKPLSIPEIVNVIRMALES